METPVNLLSSMILTITSSCAACSSKRGVVDGGWHGGMLADSETKAGVLGTLKYQLPSAFTSRVAHIISAYFMWV